MPSRSAVLACCLLLACSGCLGVFDQRPPSDERALETREQFAAAVESTDSYRFESAVDVSATSDEGRRSASATGDGAVNRTTRHVASVGTSDGETRRSYVLGYTAYEECGEPWTGWGVEQLDNSTSWVEYTPLGRYLTILNDSRVYWRGTETVNGTNASVIVAHPTKETLESAADGRSGANLGRAGFENATLKLWIDGESGLPVRSLLRIEVERRGASAEAVVTTEYADYGDHVRVSPPNSIYGNQYELGCPG